MPIEIVICVVEHAKLGWILAPYFIESAEHDMFFNANKKVVSLKQIDNSMYLFEKEKEVMKLFEEISDASIHHLFDKKKSNQKDFYKNLKNEFILHHIRPYIELRLHKILHLIKETRFKIFLKSKKYNNIYLSDEIKIKQSKSSASFNFIRSKEGIRYFLSIDNFKLTHQEPVFLAHDPCVMILHKKLYQFATIDAKKLQPFLSKEFVFIPRKSEKKYFETFVANIIKSYTVKHEGFGINNIDATKQAIISLENDLQNNPVIILKFKYNKHVFLMHNKNEKLVQFHYGEIPEFQIINRDFSWEKQFKNLLEELGLYFAENSNFYLHHTKSDSSAFYHLICWINENYQTFVEHGIEIQQQFFKKAYYLKPYVHEIKVEENNDWFDIYGEIQFNDFTVPFFSLQKNILHQIREYVLPNGEIFIIPEEWFARYFDIFKFAKISKKTLQLQKIHFHLIDKNIYGIEQKLSKKLEELKQQSNPLDFDIPKELNAQLRSYQLEGYRWLRFLGQNDFGGCLADDMGLGKTVQTIALLLSQRKQVSSNENNTNENVQLDLFASQENKTTKIPTLIVVPASLVYNWINELRKFAPSLSVNNFTGSARFKHQTVFNQFDLIITTYGIIRNDINLFASHKFHYIVLDESQVIKNPNSKIYKAVKELESNRKIVLTGTPIENSLSDLWSQFNFFNEGLLGNYNFFKREFLHPIEKFHDEKAKVKLQNLIRPFILRRTKMQVEKDLPDMTEQIIHCPMSESQLHFYEEEKSKIRNYIFENIGNQGIAKSSIHILKGLTKLRQLANHPKMVEKDYMYDSGKFDEITRNMQNVLDEGHKLLLFSSFVKHLELFKEYFEQHNINFVKLTGETTNRGAIVEKFQHDEEVKIFLISLKAGGIGLNLTAADYVFIVDPWWNPAAEIQAVSRAHRIGQDKKVFLYRFITKNSIEEKIVNLQQRKNVLSETIIESNNPLKNLTEKDIEQLFK